MRKISMSGWVVFGGFVGLGAIVSACSSDASTAASSPNVNFENPEFDGGTVAPGFDGSTGLPPTDDAATTADSAVTTDAGPGPATITVLSGTTPLTTAKVVFQRADGTVIDTLGTDGKGQASHDAEKDMMVTIVNVGAQRLTTFVGVQPNDSLVLDDGAAAVSGGATLSAMFPAAPGGTTKLYTVRAGTCVGTNGATTVSVTANSSCVNAEDGTVPVLVSNLLGNGGSAPPAWTILPKNPLAASGTTTIDFTKIVNGGWTTTFDTITATVANAGMASGIQPSLRAMAGGVPFIQPTNPISYTGNTAKFSQDNVPRAFDGQQLDVVSATVASGEVAVSVIAKRFSGIAVSEDGSTLLPQITATLVDTSTASRPRVTWSSTAPLTNTDGGVVRIFGTSVGKVVPSWTFVIPPGSTEVKAPALPADVVAYIPGGTLKAQLMFIESDQIAGYDAFRSLGGYKVFARSLNLGGLQSFATFLPLLPANGTVRATARAPWNG